MGFDVSFHPFACGPGSDLERVLAYLGGGSPGMLFAEAAARERVRFRAKGWALAALRARDAQSGVDAAPGLDADLHVWGRPFLCAGDTPPEVASAIDRYLAAATSAEVDHIAREMLARIDPALRVAPEEIDADPRSDEAVRLEVRRELDVLRAAVVALERGAPSVPLPDGGEASPVDLLIHDLPRAVLVFLARLRPGWMERGHVWPTQLLSEAGFDTSVAFQSPDLLYGDLHERFPVLMEHDHPNTIVQNYMVGGVLLPGSVARIAGAMRDEREELLAGPRRGGWEDHAALALRKLDEAMGYAAVHDLAFAEATEIYSGFAGQLN